MIALAYSAISSTTSSNNGTSELLPNPLKSLNTVLLRSSRNPSATSIIIGGIKIIILGLKAITDDTAGQQLLY
jgi:hypothetical protein